MCILLVGYWCASFSSSHPHIPVHCFMSHMTSSNRMVLEQQQQQQQQKDKTAIMLDLQQQSSNKPSKQKRSSFSFGDGLNRRRASLVRPPRALSSGNNNSSASVSVSGTSPKKRASFSFGRRRSSGTSTLSTSAFSIPEDEEQDEEEGQILPRSSLLLFSSSSSSFSSENNNLILPPKSATTTTKKRHSVMGISSEHIIQDDQDEKAPKAQVKRSSWTVSQSSKRMSFRMPFWMDPQVSQLLPPPDTKLSEEDDESFSSSYSSDNENDDDDAQLETPCLSPTTQADASSTIVYTEQELQAMRQVRDNLIQDHGIHPTLIGKAFLAICVLNCKCRVEKATTKLAALYKTMAALGAPDGASDQLWRPEACRELASYIPVSALDNGASVIWIFPKGRQVSKADQAAHVYAATMNFVAAHADPVSLRQGIGMVFDISVTPNKAPVGNELLLQQLYQGYPQRPQFIRIAGASLVVRKLLSSLFKITTKFTKQKILHRIRFVSLKEAVSALPADGGPVYLGGNAGGKTDDMAAWVQERLSQVPIPDL